jgi:hypothetical protein
MIKSRRKRWAEHVVRMPEMRTAHIIFVGNHERKGRVHFLELGVDGRII